VTCIVGFVDKKTGKVYIGAERGLFDDDNHYVSPEPKILKKKIGVYNSKPIYMIIGNAGDIKPGNIVTHWQTGKLNYDPTKQTPHEFIVTVFIQSLKKLFDKNGYKKPENFELIVGFDGAIFLIAEDYSVIIPAEYGVGCGSAHVPAIGALFAMNNLKLKIQPKKKIQIAIEAAIGISNFAKGPIDILMV
jgi:hypothetical protein